MPDTEKKTGGHKGRNFKTVLVLKKLFPKPYLKAEQFLAPSDNLIRAGCDTMGVVLDEGEEAK